MVESMALFEGVFRNLPIDAMPESVWLQFAWLCAVGGEVFEHTELRGISQGTLHVRCRSAGALKGLESQGQVLEKLRRCGCRRRLPRIDRLAVSVGELVEEPGVDHALKAEAPDPVRFREAFDVVGDSKLAAILARIAPK